MQLTREFFGPRIYLYAAVVKLANTQHSKCCERELLSVQLRPAAPKILKLKNLAKYSPGPGKLYF